jgi:hypothetical protein
LRALQRFFFANLASWAARLGLVGRRGFGSFNAWQSNNRKRVIAVCRFCHWLRVSLA